MWRTIAAVAAYMALYALVGALLTLVLVVHRWYHGLGKMLSILVRSNLTQSHAVSTLMESYKQSFSPLTDRYRGIRILGFISDFWDTDGSDFGLTPDATVDPNPLGDADCPLESAPSSVSRQQARSGRSTRQHLPPQQPPPEQGLPPTPDETVPQLHGNVSDLPDSPLARFDTHIGEPPAQPESTGSHGMRPTTPSRLPQRDEELWMEDGNLILVTPSVQFRVYRGPLIGQSLVFRDMLSLPQPAEHFASRHPSCADCIPCITIPLSDSPEDLRHFLRVMTGQSTWYVTLHVLQEPLLTSLENSFGGLHPTFDEISALVRMGNKYQCDKLVNRCVDYLKRYYHDDFDLWRNDEAVFSPPSFKPIHNIGVVNLAQLLGVDVILPGALMGCCMLGMEIVEGFTREDGTRETLSLEDLGRCYLGRANLLEANAEATLKLMKQSLAPGCRRPERCEPTMRKILHGLADDSQNVLFSLRWDWSWTPFIEREDKERNMCSECFKMLGKRGRQKEIHRAIFRKLPSLMGVKVERWGLPPVESESEAQDPPPPDPTTVAAPVPAAQAAAPAPAPVAPAGVAPAGHAPVPAAVPVGPPPPLGALAGVPPMAPVLIVAAAPGP